MKNLYIYPAVLTHEATGYSIWSYDIKGCVSQGDTIEEAVENIKDALGLFFEDYKESEKDIPTPSNPETISLEDNQILVLVEFDWLEYSKKYNNKAVRKTLTIPAWLNTIAEEQHINFSKVLQGALMEKFNV